jgi:hypothetical protein
VLHDVGDAHVGAAQQKLPVERGPVERPAADEGVHGTTIGIITAVFVP